MTHPSSAFMAIGQVADIPRRGARVVKHPDGDIAVFRAMDDTIFALPNQCPHKGGPLSDGIVHGHSVTCPLHNWVIDLATGEAQAPDHGCAGSIVVHVTPDGSILLDLSRRAFSQAAE